MLLVPPPGPICGALIEGPAELESLEQPARSTRDAKSRNIRTTGSFFCNMPFDAQVRASVGFTFERRGWLRAVRGGMARSKAHRSEQRWLAPNRWSRGNVPPLPR